MKSEGRRMLIRKWHCSLTLNGFVRLRTQNGCYWNFVSYDVVTVVTENDSNTEVRNNPNQRHLMFLRGYEFWLLDNPLMCSSPPNGIRYNLSSSKMAASFFHAAQILQFNEPFEYGTFLDAFSHLYKRVRPSVGRSVPPSVTHELNFWVMGWIWTK